MKVALDPIRPVCRHIKDGDTEMYAGRNSHKDGGRYESDLSTSQRMPRIVVSARTEMNSSLWPSEGVQPCGQLGFALGFQNSEK